MWTTAVRWIGRLRFAPRRKWPSNAGCYGFWRVNSKFFLLSAKQISPDFRWNQVQLWVSFAFILFNLLPDYFFTTWNGNHIRAHTQSYTQKRFRRSVGKCKDGHFRRSKSARTQSTFVVGRSVGHSLCRADGLSGRATRDKRKRNAISTVEGSQLPAQLLVASQSRSGQQLWTVHTDSTTAQPVRCVFEMLNNNDHSITSNIRFKCIKKQLSQLTILIFWTLDWLIDWSTDERKGEGEEEEKFDTIQASASNHDTIGMIAIDTEKNIAVGTSTNGMNHKLAG